MERTTERNTAQTECITERVLLRLDVTPHHCGSRLYQAKRGLHMSPDELFARMINLESEAVRTRLRQSSARHSLAAVYPAVVSRKQCLTERRWESPTRAQAEVIPRLRCEMDNRAVR